MDELKRDLGSRVRFSESDEAGVIIGHAVYIKESEDKYLVRYKNGCGCQVEEWVAASALRDC